MNEPVPIDVTLSGIKIFPVIKGLSVNAFTPMYVTPSGIIKFVMAKLLHHLNALSPIDVQEVPRIKLVTKFGPETPSLCASAGMSPL